MTQQTISAGGPDISREEFERLTAALDQPDWLRERRIEAWRRYESMDLPDSYDEEWRRTDVRSLPTGGLRVDGITASIELPGAAKGAGVIACDLGEAAAAHGGIVQRYLDSAIGADWKYLALNAAHRARGSFVYVPDDVELKLPIWLAQSVEGDGAAAFPRTLIVAGRNARVTMIDESRSQDGLRTLVSGAVEIIAGDGAKVAYYSVNRWGDNVYNFNTVRAVLGRDAEFVATVAGIGSKLTKMRIDAEMPQPGARAELLGVTFGSGDQHFDYNTRQEHTGDHTVSDLRFKSALTDRASLVWYGVTRINPPAAGSEASQTSRNLLLSEHAKAAPIPILEIEAYDVSKCSHAATVGPVDEEELFYLQAHGIDGDTSERMLVEGFFADVIDRVPDAALRAHIMDAVLAKVGGPADGTITFDEVMGAPA